MRSACSKSRRGDCSKIWGICRQRQTPMRVDGEHALLAVRELGRDGLLGGQGAKEGVEAVVAMFLDACLLCLISDGFGQFRLEGGHDEMSSERRGRAGSGSKRLKQRTQTDR